MSMLPIFKDMIMRARLRGKVSAVIVGPGKAACHGFLTVVSSVAAIDREMLQSFQTMVKVS